MGLRRFLKWMYGANKVHPAPLPPDRIDPVFGELTGGDGEWIASMPLNPGGASVEVCIQIESKGDRLERAFELVRGQFKAMLASKSSLRNEMIEWIRRYFAQTGEPLDLDLSRLSFPLIDDPPVSDPVQITRDPIELDSLIVGVDDGEAAFTLSYTGIIYNHWCHFEVQDGKLTHAEVNG